MEGQGVIYVRNGNHTHTTREIIRSKLKQDAVVMPLVYFHWCVSMGAPVRVNMRALCLFSQGPVVLLMWEAISQASSLLCQTTSSAALLLILSFIYPRHHHHHHRRQQHDEALHRHLPQAKAYGPAKGIPPR